jgi:hypothetical protein
MNVAVGYRWFPTAAGYHLERALLALGCQVSYVGLLCGQRPGYDSSVPVGEVLQALTAAPDLYLWIDPAGRYFPPGIEDLGLPTACYLIDVHLGNWRQQAARFFDAVFLAQKDYVPAFQRAVGHDQVYWLPLGAAADVHRQHDLPRVYDVGFVGNVSLAHRGTARSRRLGLISQRFRTNDFHRPYTPAEVGEVYSQSKIVFNTSIAGDVTMRVFEGTACGALVLTDSVANGFSELFQVGREIVTYADDTDLLQKITYYLEHDEEREAIARAGQKRTLEQHTYGHRAKAMLDVVHATGFRRLAPMRQADPAQRRRARRVVCTHLHMLDAILDESRVAGVSSLQRAWEVAPCLARRLLQ